MHVTVWMDACEGLTTELVKPASQTQLPSKDTAFAVQVPSEVGAIVGSVEGSGVGSIVGWVVGIVGPGTREHTRLMPLPIGKNPWLQMQLNEP